MRKIRNQTVRIIIFVLLLSFLFVPITTEATVVVEPLRIMTTTFYPCPVSCEVQYGIFMYNTPNTANAVRARFCRILNEEDRASVANDLTAAPHQYEGVIELATGTPEYNCHSYAWYSQDYTTNFCWIEDPSPYYLDGSYYEVTTPMVGDIICYYLIPELPEDEEWVADIINHSGIVVDVLSGVTSNGLVGSCDTVIVESKWGPGELVRHNGFNCPYIMEGSYFDYENVYIRYFRKSGHTHSHTDDYIDTGNIDFHQAICSCGQIIHEEHRWESTPVYPREIISPNYIPMYTCRDCGARSPMMP